MKVIDKLISTVFKRKNTIYTGIHEAILIDDIDAVKYYLTDGVNINAQTEDELGWTPLIHASGRGRTEIVLYLISQNADVNIKSKHLDTALHMSAVKGYETITKALVEHGADITAIGGDNHTPIELAGIRNNTNVIAILQEAADKALQ